MDDPPPQLRRFAGREGKAPLYKFKPFCSDTEKSRVREILIEHKVYFSRPSQLNDPFDLSAVLDVSRDRKTLLADAERHWATRTPPYKATELQRLRRWVEAADYADLARTFKSRARDAFERYWVFSLAGNREHPMLWSHYADGHRGLCIHLLTDHKSPFWGAERVHYGPERPVLPLPITLSEQETADRLTLRKGTFWSYEEEYRVVRHPTVDYSSAELIFQGQHAYFPARALAGITVGARMPTSDIKVIQTIAAHYSPPLPVWQAQEQETYDLTFVQL